MSPVIQMCMTSVIRNRWLRSIWMLNTMLARKMISAERYWPAYRHCAMRFRSCIEYYRLLTFVHERDGNVCQVCDKRKRRMEMHHRKTVILHPHLALDKDNVVLLCGDTTLSLSSAKCGCRITVFLW